MYNNGFDTDDTAKEVLKIKWDKSSKWVNSNWSCGIVLTMWNEFEKTLDSNQACNLDLLHISYYNICSMGVHRDGEGIALTAE